MANMSYCRFSNTVSDLRDCYDHIDDNDLSEAESQAREQLIALCREIAALFEYDGGPASIYTDGDDPLY